MYSEGLYERGMMMLQRKKEIAEENTEEKTRKELEEVFDYPEINYHSRIIIGDRDPLYFHEYSTKWLEDRNKKIEESRKFAIENERSFSPIRRAGTPPGYQSIITDWENRVASYYEKKNKHSDFYSHMPEINALSKAMLPEWNERVEERLTRMNIEKIEKLEEMRLRANVNEVPSFCPKTNEFNKTRPEDVGKHLYQEGLLMIEKRKQATEMVLNNQFAFQPCINENSRVLAANRKPKIKSEVVVENTPSRLLKTDEFECFLERNYTKQLNKKAKVEESLDNKPVEENPSKKKGGVLSGKRLYEMEMSRIERKEAKRLEILRAREISELDGCTFRPKVTNRTRTPPPMPKKENKDQKYCKTPLTNREFIRYEDTQGKVTQLKAFYHIDKSLLICLESLEKRVSDVIKL